MGRVILTFSRIYLDANILIAAVGGDAKSDIALPLLDIIGSVRPGYEVVPFVTSELTLAETLVRAIRNGDERQEEAFDNALTSSGWLETVPVSRGILWAAASLRARHPGLRLPDAIHMATALSADCPHVLTADTGLTGLYRAGAFRNGEWVEGTNITTIIRPDVETLNAILSWVNV
jgi:predicted nucleic acid-binding protein